MTAPRSRILLVVAAALLAVGAVVVALPDRGSPRSEVGTRDDGRRADDEVDRAPGLGRGDDDGAAGPGATDGDDDEAALVTDGTTAPGSGSAAPVPAPSTVPADPTSTTSTTVPPAPRTLAGRIAWVESDAALGTHGRRVWSAASDGSDRRPELPTCSPGLPFGSWLDVSPDGTRVALDCGGSAPGSSGGGITVQDVATGRSRTLLEHGMFDAPTVRWSNDGRWLAVAGRQAVWIVAADGLEVRRVPLAQPLDSTVVTWAPDDRTLLSEHAEVIDVETGAVTRRSDLLEGAVPAPASYSHQIRWGLDGRLYLQVAWQTGAGTGTFHDDAVVFHVDRATGARTEVVHQSTFLGRLELLPDGRLLLNDGPDAFYSVGPDGTGRLDLPLPRADGAPTAARGVRAHRSGTLPPLP